MDDTAFFSTKPQSPINTHLYWYITAIFNHDTGSSVHSCPEQSPPFLTEQAITHAGAVNKQYSTPQELRTVPLYCHTSTPQYDSSSVPMRWLLQYCGIQKLYKDTLPTAINHRCPRRQTSHCHCHYHCSSSIVSPVLGRSCLARGAKPPDRNNSLSKILKH